MTYTLITGASAGIGRAIAEECAKRNMNLILVALPGPELKEVALSIQTLYNVSVECLEQDLSDENAPEIIYNWCQQNKLEVDMLVNNVGMGHKGSFEETSNTFYSKMMMLNMHTIVGLTRLFLPGLKDLNKGYILNVGSLSALFPVPYKSVYAASKSFVLSFSMALRQEVKSTSVSVSCLCPNGVVTSDEVMRRIEAAGPVGKITQSLPGMVAKKAIKDLLNNKAIIIPGILNRLLAFIAWLLPKQTVLNIGGHFMQKPVLEA
ncbi:MAG: SDR family NAD(P)-dependent oxidoreductase [Cyclobacteriaceae bacterium]|nr:SDR family NAD(P)-dependent oxidoreductase [Cyclobacteriaceae bacterium]